MPEKPTRLTRWLLLIVLAAAAVAVAVALRPRHETPAAAPQKIASNTGSPPFTRWTSFERVSPGDEEILSRQYVDAILAHQVFRMLPAGLPSQVARGLLLDDDELLFSSGRRLWNKELLSQPGLAGKFCYLHSSNCAKRLFDAAFFVDGKPLVIYDNEYEIERYPSHTLIRYRKDEVSFEERKFITYDDRAVAAYAVKSNDGKPHEFAIEVSAPYPLLPGDTGTRAFPLLGQGRYQGIPLYVYLDAPGFERLPGGSVHLRRQLPVDKDRVAHAAVAYRFDNQARPLPAPPLDDDPLPQHQADYNRWFAENVPYFDSSDFGFKKMWYYRWWIVRFHLLEADTPDLRGYAFYEGKMGFDNVIGFAVPLQVKELSYLRDPRFALSQIANSYRNLSKNGAVLDPPGSPYWNETYSHWIAAAVAELNRVQPIPASTLRELLPAMAGDVRAWLSAYDSDGDFLPERREPRVTGYDLDILSYWYFNDVKLDLRVNPPPLERVDFASFVYANAAAVSELAAVAGDKGLAAEFEQLAGKVREAVLANLWDDDSRFFYPRRVDNHARIPIRELHGFFPITNLLVPDRSKYLAALERFVDPNEFWSRYPPVITSLKHYQEWTWEMDGLSRNIAPHPISMGARTLLQAIKHYDQSTVTADHFMDLMTAYNSLVYPGVHPRDPYWRPNVHEYYSKWEPHANTPQPKPSDISHDFHSMFCALVVEGAVGLTPRADEKIEIQPLARRWTYFLLDGLRYHGHDLTIVWDKPDGNVRYRDYPEGFSLYIDGQVAFTRPDLDHLLYDPATRQAATVD